MIKEKSEFPDQKSGQLAIYAYRQLANCSGSKGNKFLVLILFDSTFVGENRLQSNDKAMLRATFQEVNSKIIIGEGSSSITPLK